MTPRQQLKHLFGSDYRSLAPCPLFGCYRNHKVQISLCLHVAWSYFYLVLLKWISDDWIKNLQRFCNSCKNYTAGFAVKESHCKSIESSSSFFRLCVQSWRNSAYLFAITIHLTHFQAVNHPAVTKCIYLHRHRPAFCTLEMLHIAYSLRQTCKADKTYFCLCGRHDPPVTWF